jgi:purine-nucleoside phosphorylase
MAGFDSSPLPVLPRGIQLREDYALALAALRAELLPAGFAAPLAVVLGSGLSAVVDGVQVEARRSFAELPGFHAPTVESHAGALLQCRMDQRPLLVLQGRLHAYEGLRMADVLFPVAALWALGAERILLTNAAGGLHPGWAAGEFMLISDIVDLHLVDPLRGLVQSETEAAPGRSSHGARPLDAELRKAIAVSATRAGIGFRQGCYASVWGPNYETGAEIGMLRFLGADAVGMSTGPECSLLSRLGVRVAGISCITNVAMETGGTTVSHAEVVQMGERRQALMSRLVLESLALMAEEGAR